MKYLLVVLVIFILLVIATTTEHMTNKDLISTLKTFGDKGTPSSKKKTSPIEAPIYGPRAPAVQHSTPSKKPGNIPSAGVYPDIFGPEYQGLPGSKSTKSNTTDDVYTFNPDLQKAFPTDGEPQPFLTDFSKFQH